MTNAKGASTLTIVIAIVAGLAAAGICFALLGVPRMSGSAAAPLLTTPYQAVLLTNGQVYFGKLAGLGTPFPVLSEVYYVQSGVNPQTKEQTNILLKRGKEWHAPDRMILNATHIMMVEPVQPDSKVAQLISQLH
jgi:hypothetical protein